MMTPQKTKRRRPSRKVVGSATDNTGCHIDFLECGHDVYTDGSVAKTRTCYDCGRGREENNSKIAAGVGGICQEENDDGTYCGRPLRFIEGEPVLVCCPVHGVIEGGRF